MELNDAVMDVLRHTYTMHQMECGVIPYRSRWGDPEAWHEHWKLARKALSELPDDIKRQLEPQRKKRARL